MNRRFRLTRNLDFKRVRKFGRTYAHPLIVLITAPNDCKISRVGIITSRNLGNAVKRNRIRRQIRHCMSSLLPSITESRDMILIPKATILGCDQLIIEAALKEVLIRAKLHESKS